MRRWRISENPPKTSQPKKPPTSHHSPKRQPIFTLSGHMTVRLKEGTSYSPKCKGPGSYPKRRQHEHAKLNWSQKTHWVGVSLDEGCSTNNRDPPTYDSAPIRNQPHLGQLGMKPCLEIIEDRLCPCLPQRDTRAGRFSPRVFFHGIEFRDPKDRFFGNGIALGCEAIPELGVPPNKGT